MVDKKELEEAVDVIETSPAGTPHARHAKTIVCALRESQAQLRAAEEVVEAAKDTVKQQGRMRDNWSDVDKPKQSELWGNLHLAANILSDALTAYSSKYPAKESA